MNINLKVQLSVLIGILGFFLGGILNLKKEIIDIILYACIGWAISFFLTFFILTLLTKENKKKFDKNEIKTKIYNNNVKGKKIDILISDDLDEIYNLKR